MIDYTGSMGGAIDSIKSEVSNIVNTIMAESGGDYRLALGIFDEYPKRSGPSYMASPAYTALPAAQKKIITSGTSTDQHLTMMEKFAPANATSFSTQLAFLNNNPNMPMGWGINGPEPGDLLLYEMLNNNNSRVPGVAVTLPGLLLLLRMLPPAATMIMPTQQTIAFCKPLLQPQTAWGTVCIAHHFQW
ncbi:hypothetical protein LWM68_43195 [Niabella sp. W65]|nr:hypothetical protein [Niabella sp. W65]MCH7368945.1 hypothetical protein [Niabella sp. W65]